MPLYRPYQINWGPGLTTTLIQRDPLDDATSWGTPPEESEFARGPSGVRDAWIPGGVTKQFLAGDMRWIPNVDEAGSTGWDGPAGVDAWLNWMRAGNWCRMYLTVAPFGHHDVYLVEPMKGEPQREDDGTRRLRVVFEDLYDNPFVGY